MDDAYVELFWLPLGAGEITGLVRRSGRLFEAATARRQRRPPADLYHSALRVSLDGIRYVIEMAPVWRNPEPDRGVVAEGPVGLAWLGRSRLFRYEVRCWPGGAIPDLAWAVDSPQRLSTDPAIARRMIEVVPAVPTLIWGRDQQRTGEMWNSNSVTAWLLNRCGLADAAVLPRHGRAPGWSAGLTVAA